ncbi:tRNA epoxyqueuosine(34) reductase QueG [Natranaerofaba carboxydovora]|uniref:tRNA epoxyqueuosine(34) reductase QueG n=1 Tax=Natranaerofaba carboxydovora TaxID=2742683 RepID=UPI001F139671|nr:tRNA epoxyqueuosine(34) reductase QueG [Natranaerofaba carboxydovora]UMZ74505.1 Epoxyqueuosine reductase [Natranaerofaba carboxydovora]
MELLDLIKNEANDLGFLDIGIIDAKFSVNSAKRLLKRKKLGENTPFVPRDITVRVSPKKYAFWANSVIVVTFPYNFRGGLTKKPVDEHLRGRISKSAWGKDYHLVLKDKLNALGEQLRRENVICKYQAFVDTSPLADRELAFRAGIGTFGKNNNLISNQGGSFIFIGGLLTDKELPRGLIDNEAEKASKRCLECEKCIKSCPGNALLYGNRLKVERCVSYLTVKKGYIEEEYRPMMADNIYGCDRCVEVCPVNYSHEDKCVDRNTDKDIDELLPKDLTKDDIFPRLDFLLGLSNKKFKMYYGNTAISWRGKAVIQRNAAIAAGNLKDPRGLDLLLKSIKEKGEIVTCHSLWSIGMIYDNLTNKQKVIVENILKDFRGKRKDIWSEELEDEYQKLIEKIFG